MIEQKDSAVTIETPRRYMTYAYIASLTFIAILLVVAHLVLDHVIEHQSQNGELITKAHQQSMLSQRVSMFTADYLRTGSLESKASAQSSLQQMQANHQSLLSAHNRALHQGQPSPLSAEMLALYFEEPVNLDKQFSDFSESVNSTLNAAAGNVDKLLVNTFFILARQPLFDALDRLAQQYKIEGAESINDLRMAQNIVLIFIILTLLIDAFFVVRPIMSKVNQFAQRLQYEANYDHLSGIYNRRSFFMIAGKQLQTAKRYKKTCSLILIDIDKFKGINDKYGHETGDQVIHRIANIFKKNLREADILARLGGEEFVAFLPETDKAHALIVAEKLRLEIEQMLFVAHGEPIKITVSGGVAETDLDDDLAATIKQADERLYLAKKTGRNQVCTT